jgi:hypothetical protein
VAGIAVFRPVGLGFLGASQSRCESAIHSYLILLDFLGFSRSKRAFSIGYGEKRIKDFSRCLSRAVSRAGM